MNNQTTRIPSLDGLRTFSIALVIISHLSYSYNLTSLANLGDLGVRIFFVISGFLITGLLLKELDENDSINLAKFYFRRTLRIFPAFYFFVFFILFLMLSGKILLTFSQFIPVLTYTSNYFYPASWELDHVWSLSVEEQFYLIFPGILAFFGRRKTKILLGLAVLLCPLIRLFDYQIFAEAKEIWLTKGFHANVDSLAVGCLLAFMREKLHNNNIYKGLVNSPFLFFLPILIIFVNELIDYKHLYLGLFFSLNNLLIAFFIDWSVTNSEQNFVGKLLNTKLFIFIGMMSYSIYLWQQPFLNPDPPIKYFAFPFGLVPFLIFTCFSYFVVEKFFLNHRRGWEIKFFDKKC